MSSFRQTATGALRRITTTAHELHVRKSNHDDPQCPKQSSQKLSRDNSNGIGNSSGSGSDSSSVRQRQASFSAEVPDAKLEAKVVTSSLNEDGGGTDGVQTHNTGPRFSSATSAAITRLKGTIRAGSKKRSLKPRSLTLDAGLPFLRGGKRGGNAGEAPPYAHQDDSLPRGRKIARNSCEMSPRRENAGGAGHDVTSLANDGKTTDEKRTKLSVIFDDDEGTNDAVAEDGRIATSDDLEYATDPRSKWTSTLMASTLARGRAAGKQNVSDRVGLFPHPRDAGNRVEYMIMVCKAVQGYASSQAPKLERVRDGRHIMSQLTDVASDLSRQREKILAVYDVREVSRSADRLGDTLKAVYDVLGDVEDTSVMFGKKKGFGKRVSALVHDIGTHANSLLAATSLAIADRPNVLYMTDTGAGEPPMPQQDELLRRCIEGDKYYYGRGEKANLKKAFEEYSWAAERGCTEAMYMSAWMYRAGAFAEVDVEKCKLWLERAVEKGYAPAMNDLGVILLGEADLLERIHPELKADRNMTTTSDDWRRETNKASAAQESPNGAGENPVSTVAERKTYDGDEHVKVEEKEREKTRACGDIVETGHGTETAGQGAEERSTSLPPEQARLFEGVMATRKRAMQLFQGASKTGHTDAMINFGNMQEAMGYFDEARHWYRLAAEPSESANNPRAQNYLGVLFYEGQGVTKDLGEAVKWFRRGARQGNAQACQNLGICCQAGLGVAKDLPKAMELFRQAVEGGSTSAANNLAYVLAMDALHTLVTAARQAPTGTGGTGLTFEDPSRRVMKTDQASSQASDQVWRESTRQLREAADLFRRAADNGVTDAAYQLGRLYQQGLGIPQDPAAAFENFLAAADGSPFHPSAAGCVGDMLYTGTGCLQNYGEALKYYRRAAHAGEPASANAAGLMHEVGRGVNRDIAAAGEWYRMAADLGSADGAFNGALLLERGDPLAAFASAAGVLLPPEQQRASGVPYASHAPSRYKGWTAPKTSRSTTSPIIGCDISNNKYNHDADEREDASQPPHDDSIKETAGQRCHHLSWETRPQKQQEQQQATEEQNCGGEFQHGQQRLKGNRSLALRMYQRAVELGHSRAAREVDRLQLRERMDGLVEQRMAMSRMSLGGGSSSLCSAGRLQATIHSAGGAHVGRV